MGFTEGFLFAVAFAFGMAANGPTPSDLTDACQAKTVVQANSNVSSISYDHCAK